MDNKVMRAYGEAVSAAFKDQQVLLISYMNLQGDVSTRRIVPCSPIAVNPDGTANFEAYSEIVKTTGSDRGHGVITLRLDNILSLEAEDTKIEDVQSWWRETLGAKNGGTVVFPGEKTPLFRGHFPAPTIATEHLNAYLERGWTTEPTPAYRLKPTRSNAFNNGEQVSRLQ